jgi:hypothetical protein
MGNPHSPTQKHTAPGHAVSGYHEPVVNDPEHDVDGKMSAILIVGGTVVFFACFWLLWPIFDQVMTREQARKINSRPNTELQQLIDAEQAFLRGEANKSKKSIEQVMAESIRR